MKKIRLTEGDLHRIVKESIRKVLNENSEITLEWESHDDDWRIPVDYKCTIRQNGYAEVTSSLYHHKYPTGFYIPFPLYDKNGELNKYKIEEFAEEKWHEEVDSMY